MGGRQQRRSKTAALLAALLGSLNVGYADPARRPLSGEMTMTKKVVLSIAALAAVTVAAAYARTVRVEGAHVTRLAIGDPAPDFKLFGVDFRYHSLSMYPDKKAVVVGFHCNHCPISRMNRKAWVELANAFHDKDIQVLAINPNPADKVRADGFLQMIEVANENDYPFPYLYDETQAVAAAYGARRTDDVFILGPADEHGTRRVVYNGPLNNHDAPPHYVADALNAILAGHPIQTPEVPEFGCTIKYRTEQERKNRGVQLN